MNSDGLDVRVRDVIGAESVRSFAHRAGVKQSTLQSILKGTKPTVDNLIAIAEAAGVHLDWLATGIGPMRRGEAAEAAKAAPVAPAAPAPGAETPALDSEFLGLVLEGVHTAYREENARIDQRSAGRLAGDIYKDIMAAVDGDDDPGARRAALRMAVQALRRNLRSHPDQTQGKRQA